MLLMEAARLRIQEGSEHVVSFNGFITGGDTIRKAYYS